MGDSKGLILGELAVQQGLLTADQLDACLQWQIDERNARPLGEVMVDLGFVRREALDALLGEQKAALARFEEAAEYGQLFGRAAVSKGFLTEEMLSQALRAQARAHARGARVKIGQVMIELRVLSIRQFWEVLHAQGDFKCGTCGAAIETPVFRETTVICESCKAPAFEVATGSGGPKPRKRRSRKK